ncbi:MAG: twin-arginine translocase TatA/TatE family subunit [Maricaulis sp.]|jgi:sec-independent protein translocase protein TatA|nr:twin-arginine translocase TatA/TatE family subunit [Maricaulis sp.]MDG2044659.1 twin-arginine translocase TatA/TatE family subunit [Maricaulis sp.]
MAPGMWQLIIVVVLAALLFGGKGKIASVMGDFAKGITSFRKGLKDEEGDESDDASGEAKNIDSAKSDDEKAGD